jgi:DNA-binding transcriptional regulator YdaS (Cro superfamily)
VRLKEYVDRQALRDGVTATTILQSLAEESGVSFQTCSTAYRGAAMNRYDKAKAIQTATGGRVTIKELCEP